MFPVNTKSYASDSEATATTHVKQTEPKSKKKQLAERIHKNLGRITPRRNNAQRKQDSEVRNKSKVPQSTMWGHGIRLQSKLSKFERFAGKMRRSVTGLWTNVSNLAYENQQLHKQVSYLEVQNQECRTDLDKLGSVVHEFRTDFNKLASVVDEFSFTQAVVVYEPKPLVNPPYENETVIACQNQEETLRQELETVRQELETVRSDIRILKESLLDLTNHITGDTEDHDQNRALAVFFEGVVAIASTAVISGAFSWAVMTSG